MPFYFHIQYSPQMTVTLRLQLSDGKPAPGLTKNEPEQNMLTFPYKNTQHINNPVLILKSYKQTFN